jgi:hypothetical protein
MAYQGIITGIGENNKITPEIDAYINNFVIGKNTILDGLILDTNKLTLSKGACVLCGYRGIIEEDIKFNANDPIMWIYGKFTLNFGNGEDEFEIYTTTTQLTTNVNPSQITEAGTYYLLLYNDYNNISEDLESDYPFPKNAQNSVETENVLNGATIGSEVEGVTQDVNDISYKLATTEFAHLKIEKEIGYDSKTISVLSGTTNIGTITFIRKAKMVIGIVTVNSLTAGEVSFSIPEGFEPLQSTKINILYQSYSAGRYYQTSSWYAVGAGSQKPVYEYGITDVTGTVEIKPFPLITTFGYQCQ